MNNKNKLTIAFHGGNELIGGQYNVLSSFSFGLLKAFNNMGINATTTAECYKNGVNPNLTIGFNVTGYPTWEEYLMHNIPNIMWSVDSIFYQNFEAIEKFHSNPNFILFNVSSSDSNALKTFYPDLKHTYMPHAVDLNLWKKQDCKKEYDIVFLSSILDYEAKIEELKQQLPSDSFGLLMAMYEIWLNTPNLSFWEVYKTFQQAAGLNFNKHQYNFAFKNLTYLVTYTRRAKMIESLKEFDVKVFGNGPWEKYVKGKVQYMGSCDLLESISIVNKSKISLHLQPNQLVEGLHERVLNSCAVETFVLSTQNKSISESFGNTIDYFDFNNLNEKVEYYLKNEDERDLKAQEAYTITSNNHTWHNRAQSIMSLINQSAAHS